MSAQSDSVSCKGPHFENTGPIMFLLPAAVTNGDLDHLLSTSFCLWFHVLSPLYHPMRQYFQ